MDIKLIESTKKDNLKNIIIKIQNDLYRISMIKLNNNTENVNDPIQNRIKKYLKKIDDNNFCEVKNMIIKELNYLGYKSYYKGTKYLVECIYFLYKNQQFIGESLNKNVYPIIAERFNKNINNIKCNITRATDIMFFDCNEKKLKEYLENIDIVKPTNKIIINAVVNKILKKKAEKTNKSK